MGETGTVTRAGTGTKDWGRVREVITQAEERKRRAVSEIAATYT
jgi:hypothetical protein